MRVYTPLIRYGWFTSYLALPQSHIIIMILNRSISRHGLVVLNFLCSVYNHIWKRWLFSFQPSVLNRSAIFTLSTILMAFIFCFVFLFVTCLFGRKQLASRFNYTYTCRHIDDVVSINNPENNQGQMYPVELEIKDTTDSNNFASYLDLLLSIWRDGQLYTSIYDKHDNFNFHITNCPFLSNNIPASPAYSVFNSQLIQYARACSSYACFILRATHLLNKLLEQGYVKDRLKSSLKTFYGRYGYLIKQYEVPLSRMLNDIL